MVLIEMVRMKPVYFKRENLFHCFEGNTGPRSDSIYTAAVMRSDSNKKTSECLETSAQEKKKQKTSFTSKVQKQDWC